MMRKERELLKECRLILDTPFNGSTGINLRNRIAELLTQPEQTEQEPKIEFKGLRLNGDSYSNRKILSEDEIWNNLPDEPAQCLPFIKGIKFAEKAHGITDDIDVYRAILGLDE